MPLVLRSTSKRALFFSEAVRQARATSPPPCARAVKDTSTTGSGEAGVEVMRALLVEMAPTVEKPRPVSEAPSPKSMAP